MLLRGWSGLISFEVFLISGDPRILKFFETIMDEEN